MKRTLVAGFGNTYRRDDGVALAVVNDVRERLERPRLEPLDDGYDDLGHDLDTIVLHQMVPELAETVADYELVIFVDAHVATLPEPIHEEHMDVEYKTPFVSHQFHPSTVLALAQQMYGKAPKAVLLSVLGHDFDFGEGLSDKTAALVPEAADRILALAREETTDA
jgi:hydrogenase maturation protease